MKNSKGLVAFIDILGFSSFTLNNTFETYFGFYNNSILPIVQSALANRESKIVDGGFEPNLIYKNKNIDVIFASDNIIFYINDPSENDCFELFKIIKTLILSMIEYGNHYFRGSIVYGDVVYKHDFLSQYQLYQPLIIGKAYTQSVLLEKDQEWSGCVIDNSVIEKFPSIINSEYYIKYKIPIKEGSNQCLQNALRLFKKNDNELALMLENLEKRVRKMGKGKNKMEETVKFIKYCLANE